MTLLHEMLVVASFAPRYFDDVSRTGAFVVVGTRRPTSARESARPS